MGPSIEAVANGATTTLKPVIAPSTESTGGPNYLAMPLPPHFIGGNRLEVAPSGVVRDFVAAHGGHTVITSVSFEPLRRCYLLFWCTYLYHLCVD